MRLARTWRSFETKVILVVAVSIGVYLYNVVRFTLFNNAFDPWHHAIIIFQDDIAGTPAIDSYLGFPGLHVLVGFTSRVLGIPAFVIIKYLPAFAGALSTIVMVAFVKWLLAHRERRSNGEQEPGSGRWNVNERVASDVILLAALLNTTISLFSLVSSGMFWGQMFTASFLPVVMVKFIEMNATSEARAVAEFFLCAMTLTLVHHLTSFFLFTFLTACQLYFLVVRKASVKGVLATGVVVTFFLLRYEALEVHLGIITYFTRDRTAYFYWFFILLFAGAGLLAIARKVVPKLPRPARRLTVIGNTLFSRHRALLVAAFAISLAGAFLAWVLPAITRGYGSLSGAWFWQYGSGLFLLVPLAIAGMFAFGSLYRGSRIKIVLHGWFLVITGVLLAILFLLVLGTIVGSLEFGRLTTFVYPFLAVFAGFGAIPLIARRRETGSRRRWLRGIRPPKIVVKAAILGAFCILMPVTVVAVVPPPRTTLTRYWNTPSEQTAVSWIQQHAANGTVLNLDFHVEAMARYYRAYHGTDSRTSISREFYFLDDPAVQARLLHRNGTLILVDEVMLHVSVSFTGPDVDHGTLPPLGEDFIDTYDALPFLNKLYDSGHEWLYAIR